MDENNTTPEGTAATPEPAPVAPEGAPAASTPAPATAPVAAAPAPEPASVATPSAPVTPPVAPEPAQAGYEAQYAVTPTAQPVPGAPMPAAPVSPTPALVCGILSIVFSWIPIVGIILGIVAIVMAGKYFKAGGTEGTAKGGRICGIIGIVFSGIIIIASCAIMVIGLNELRNYQTSSPYTSSSITQNTATTATADEEEAIYAAVDPYLDQIKNQDPAMVATIASMMEEELNDELEDMNITLADCGIDPTEMALAMMEGFDYEPDYASVDGATAEANYMVTVRDCTEISDAFYDRMVEFSNDIEAGSMTEAEAYQIIGQELMAAIQNAKPVAENLWDVDLSNDTGSWIMDSESWDDELKYFFVLR